jgi:hypothetical protein
MKGLVLGLLATTSAVVGWAVWSRAAPALLAVHPATGDLPANFLRIYIDFSEPMGGDDAFEHLRLRNAQGRPMSDAFRDLELWSRNRTRLMVYIHPGRVKSGLAMGDDFGPVLEQGKRYTLEVARGMKSLRGRRVSADFRRELRIGPPETTRPELSRWRIEATRDRLEIECDRWMDQSALQDWLRVDGVPGRWEVDGRRVTFRPDRPMAAGTYTLVADARMEDVCGNSFQRPFETRPDAARAEDLPETVSRPFFVAP